MRSSAAQWNLLELRPGAPPAGFVGREHEIEILVSNLRKPNAIIELVAPTGMGKTALLMMLVSRTNDSFDGVTQFFTGAPYWSLREEELEMAENFRSVPGHHLLIIDDAHSLDRGDLTAALRLLTDGAWKISVVLATQQYLGLGARMQLHEIPYRAIRELFARSAAEIHDEDISRLIAATRGRLSLVNAFLESRAEKVSTSVSAFIESLGPWEFHGLVDAEGKPLSATDKRTQKIIADVRDIDDAMLSYLGQHPEAVFQLSSRRFEELVAELFERRGYDVTLTSNTRDGGRDIHAVRNDDFGSFLFLVEAKRYAPHQAVGVEIVRSLHGVTQLEQATAGIVVTTSRFSKPARELAQRIPYKMSLRDYLNLRAWLEEYRARATS